MFTYYHGTDNPAGIIEALLGSKMIRTGFHMTPDRAVASNYGSHIIAITFEYDLTHAHIGMINKDNNYNKSVGTGIEVVINSQQAIREFYGNLWDAVEV